MSTIWNNEELSKIINFFNKNNLKLDENDYICKNRDMEGNDFVFNSVNFSSCSDELNDLFHYQDKKEIYNILKKTIPIRYTVIKNKNNPICNGLLSTLASINPCDATEIFIIFKEVISQYVRVSYNLAERIVDKLKDPNLIMEKFKEIKLSTEETQEELYIKNYINKLFSYTYGMFDNDIFRPVIDKCNKNIKNKLLIHLDKKINLISRYDSNLKNNLFDQYLSDKVNKINKQNNKIYLLGVSK